MKTLEWPSQSPDLNPTEMLRRDLKKAVWKTLRCGWITTTSWPNFLHKTVKSSQTLLQWWKPREAQPVIRGQPHFHTGPAQVWIFILLLFLLIIKQLNLKTPLCLLCVYLSNLFDLNHLSVTNNKTWGRGLTLLHTKTINVTASVSKHEITCEQI